MSLYSINSTKLLAIKEKDFAKESQLHGLIEDNLETLFGLEFIAHEFPVDGYFIDTLAFDRESNTFVILEYKKDKSFSVVDQGIHYLQLMFKHKEAFLLELSKKRGQLIDDKKAVNWPQARVMFLARSFTPYQIGSSGLRNFPIELWQAALYENDILELSQVKTEKTSESISKLVKDEEVEKITEQVEDVTVDEHRQRADDSLQGVFDALRENILNLDSAIVEKPVRHYIGYKTHGTNFVSLTVKKNRIIVGIRLKQPEPSSLKVTKRPERAWDATPLWTFDITSPDQIHKAADLIGQAYKYYAAKYN